MYALWSQRNDYIILYVNLNEKRNGMV